MQFTSGLYLLLLAVVLLAHRLLPWRLAQWVLIVVSYVFYGAAQPWYCTLLLASTLLDFFIAPHIASQVAPTRRRLLFAISVAGNLGLLCVFKYTDFILDNVNLLAGLTGAASVGTMGWIVPAGISFYTFQTLSYTFDVYRGETKPTSDFGGFALYVAFFPQLIAGPIERKHRLLPQLQHRQPVATGDVVDGTLRILSGLVKKRVVADRLAPFVERVYSHPESLGAPEVLLGTIAFGFQLYFDFSAYSDIAIGTARLLGVRLSENFRRPFLARSAADFWSRWHMTLSRWFRDYAYRAWRGRRPGLARDVLLVLAVMTLMGLWHGPSWSFVLFGIVAGAELATQRYLRLRRGRAGRGPLFGRSRLAVTLATAGCFVEIMATMAIFRAPNLTTLRAVLVDVWALPWTWPPALTPYLLLLGALWLREALQEFWRNPLLRAPPALRGAFLLAILVFGAVESSPAFLYYRF